MRLIFCWRQFLDRDWSFSIKLYEGATVPLWARNSYNREIKWCSIEMHHKCMERTWEQRQGRHQTPVRRRVKARRGRQGGGERGSGRNAPRLRTMPSPVTNMSSWIACSPLVAISLHPRLFLLTVFTTTLHWFYWLVLCFDDNDKRKTKQLMNVFN